MKNSFLSMGLIWKYDSEEPKGALIFLKGGGLEESKGGGWVNCLQYHKRMVTIIFSLERKGGLQQNA